MIGKTLPTNITSEVGRFFEEKNQIVQKQCEIKNKIEELNNELEELRVYMNTCVSVDDINGLVQDIKNSFELFVNQTPRSNDDELVRRLNALEARVAEIPDMRIISQAQVQCESTPVSNKKEIPKLNIRKKAA